MNKTLLGTCLIILSGVAFFMWVNPHYATVKSLTAELGDSNSALVQAQQLTSLRSQLVDKENSFSPSDIAKLQKLLPTNTDSVRFVIDMQNIASRHGLGLQDIAIGDNGQAKAPAQSAGIGGSVSSFGESQLTFAVTASYSNLIAFLKDVEKSLRVIEIKSLAFSVDDKNPSVYKVSMTVGTFWLNQNSLSVTSS